MLCLLQDMGGLLESCVQCWLEIPLGSSPIPTADSGSNNSSSSGIPAGTRAAGTAVGQVDEASVQLRMDGTYTITETAGSGSQEQEVYKLLTYLNDVPSEVSVLSHSQKQQLNTRATQQLESLLHTAFKLDLPNLIKCLLGFLQNNTPFCGSLWASKKDWQPVLSPRVLAVAGTAAAGNLVARACLLRPLGRGIGIGKLFKYVLDTQPDPVASFDAYLQQDIFDFKAGCHVHVEVRFAAGTIILTRPAVSQEEAKYGFEIVCGSMD